VKRLPIEYGLEQVVKDMAQLERMIKEQFQGQWQRQPLIMTVQRLMNMWTKVRNIKFAHEHLTSDTNNLVQDFLD
jgi:hypothetical protein